ncbi:MULTISPECIES: hypothetical protein [Streptomyces]|uniref:Uncharacterized protein n=1 Tax=Streptomyces zhihengii TaxID=1818004 RepID=A0ABS2V1S2_9ACTN|nr:MULTISPECIES: hypothetical protein [Streptomyces]MBM9623097.1 hypothetical protein [Streptomyces zhihengii]TXS44780.1 hypothetical protein EAO77_32860 [Streptomyces sp. t39]
MEQGSNRVSPRKDDEMKHEVAGYLRARQQHTRMELANDPEPGADDAVPEGPGAPRSRRSR